MLVLLRESNDITVTKQQGCMSHMLIGYNQS